MAEAQLKYKINENTKKGDINRYKKGGAKLFMGEERQDNQVEESLLPEETVIDNLDILRETNHNMRKNKNDVIIPEANSELARYMEPYTESMEEPPIYESHVRSPKGSGLSFAVHSFVGLRFTGVHPFTHRLGRYYLRAGFGSEGNREASTTQKAFWKAGGLHNDTYTHADISLQRQTSPEVVDKALKFIPAHAHNSNYNLLLHNCNHFAREVALELGFGDIADMHQGMSPTSTYSNMAKRAQAGEEGFFNDYIEGNRENGLFADSETIERGDEENNLNQKIQFLDFQIRYGGNERKSILSKLPVSKERFEKEAMEELDKHGFNLRINKWNQFFSKDQAKTEITSVAEEIAMVEEKIVNLDGIDSMNKSEVRLEAMEGRKRALKEAASSTASRSRTLMQKSGIRYYRLGIYALRVATSFERLTQRLEELSKGEGIENISFKQEFGTTYSDAEVLSLFQEKKELDEGEQVREAIPIKDMEVYGNDYRVEKATSEKRAAVILGNVPEFKTMLSQKKEREAQFTQKEGTAEKCIFSIGTALQIMQGLQQTVMGNQKYMKAIASLYAQNRKEFSKEQLSYLLLQDLISGFYTNDAKIDDLQNQIFKDLYEQNGGMAIMIYHSVLQDRKIKTSKEEAKEIAINDKNSYMGKEISKEERLVIQEKQRAIYEIYLNLNFALANLFTV